MSSVFAGALVAGLIIGAIPAISGGTKGKLGLGLGGFVACVCASLLLGLLLSVPTCAVFMYFIYKKPAIAVQSGDGTTLSDSLPSHCANCGSKLEDGQSFCPHCGTKIV